MKPATCTTLADCKQHEDQVVTVVGTYRKFEVGAGKGRSWHGAVQIDLGNGGPVLGRYWHAESKRPAAEVQQYEGKQVAVTGTFRAETPPNPDEPARAARLSVPALLDVTAIELATGDETGAGADDERPDPDELPPL